MIETKSDAKFIVLEGLDGAGTTTQAELLAQHLRALGHSVHTTREPSDGPIGVTIRQALKRRLVRHDGSRLDPATIALLFAADRVDHLATEVQPHLDKGTWVISDRYVHSSLAYQGSECDVEWIAEINRQARPADLILYIEVPVETCLDRITSRGATVEIYEHREMLNAVAKRFEQSFHLREDPMVTIDGTQSIDVVHQAVSETIRAHLIPTSGRTS